MNTVPPLDGPRPEENSKQLVATDAITLDPVPGWCTQCGRQIEILPPQSFRLVSVPESKWAHELDGSLEPWPGYGDPSVCLRCRVESTSADRRDSLSSEYRPLLQD